MKLPTSTPEQPFIKNWEPLVFFPVQKYKHLWFQQTFIHADKCAAIWEKHFKQTGREICVDVAGTRHIPVTRRRPFIFPLKNTFAFCYYFGFLLFFRPTWVGSHRYVWGVVFPRREVTGVLHGAVARGSDPRGGSVHQCAPLGEEVGRSCEIPSFHSEECWIIRNPDWAGQENQMQPI